MLTFEELIEALNVFWKKQNCSLQQGCDVEVGAATFNPTTFFRVLGPEPYCAAYVEPSKRPCDGRFGNNPNRLQQFHQYQVILKPPPANIQELYLESLETIGIDLDEHDIRFVHDDWQQPSLGASGLGWEVWLDGLEITQFTYFQQMAGQELHPITVELAIGLERLAMYLQQVDDIYDIQWNDKLTYRELFHQNEVEWGQYNFHCANVDTLSQHFQDHKNESMALLQQQLPFPAYSHLMKASHCFNLLDARKALSVTKRANCIVSLRDVAVEVAKSYVLLREKTGYPLLSLFSSPDKETTQLKRQSHSVGFIRDDRKKVDDFLLEIGSEELPASFIANAESSLNMAMKKLLERNALFYKEMQLFSTPRRLAMYIHGLSQWTEKKEQEKKGPPLSLAYDGGWTEIGKRFFHSLHFSLPSLEEISQGKHPSVFIKRQKGREYLFATLQQPSRSTCQILMQQLPSLISAIPFPKRMHWDNSKNSYARPLRWIVAMMGEEVLAFQVGSIIAGNSSYGHRQLCPHSFVITHPQNYAFQLRTRFVLADVKSRREQILSQLEEIERQHHAVVLEKKTLLDEVVNLVEWPEPLLGSFDSRFLTIPSEILISEMVQHQRYFPLANKKDQTLLAHFVIISNNKKNDKIVQGHEKTLTARLNDGAFLYEQDLQTPFEQYHHALSSMSYIHDLGTMQDKEQRLKKYAEFLHAALPLGNLDLIQEAAVRCKSDLATNLVQEFPHLQGVVGRYYALKQGKQPEVARAIEEHWMPRFEGADLPTSEEGTILSIADKIDHLVCCFSAKLKATSSGDPYGLRRSALGLIRILLEKRCCLPLLPIFTQCYRHFLLQQERKEEPELVKNILKFIRERLPSFLKGGAFSKDEIDATLPFFQRDLYSAYCRLQALHSFRREKSFSSLLEAYKRVSKQLNAFSSSFPLQKALFSQEEEFQLYGLFLAAKREIETAEKDNNFETAIEALSHLYVSLEAFFSQVHIMSAQREQKENRSALLREIRSLFEQVIDFQAILSSGVNA